MSPGTLTKGSLMSPSLAIRLSALGAISCLCVALVACGDTDGGTNSGATTSGSGGAGAGSAGSGGQGGDDTIDPSTTSSSSSGAPVDCGAGQCTAEEICSHGQCTPRVTCTTDNDCKNDTRCDPSTKACVAWEDAPNHDETCLSLIAPGILSPKVKCEFPGATPDPEFPDFVDVQATPIVINLNQPLTAGPPSVIAPFSATVPLPVGYTEGRGIIRVLRGTDCGLEVNLGGVDLDSPPDGRVDWIVSPTTPAAGDLNSDGVAEIVSITEDGSTVAFTKTSGAWTTLWKSPYQSGMLPTPCVADGSRCIGSWAGLAIHDLDDDGVPEVLRGAVVINGVTGAVRSLAPAGYTNYSNGPYASVANLDQDPAIEITNGQGIWEWDGANNTWVKETYYPSADGAIPLPPAGYIAIADFGAYGTAVPANNPEIAIGYGGKYQLRAATGELLQGPLDVPGGGGGPLTIADFDGDGLPEVGVAGQDYYTVFDLDCGPSPRTGGVCPAGECDATGGTCTAGSGIAWSKKTQDHSSNTTGSSVFDFEADGKAEAVYADECFVRVYDGQSGDVLFSQYHSSCTWNENPIIADADGNLRADLIVPSNRACSSDGQGSACSMLDANGVDTQFPGLRCKEASDCRSGVCDEGLCRCTASSQCCAAGDDAACVEEGYKCAPPPAGTAGAGDTCRAVHPHGASGIRIYSDANDKWVRSRAIWNQHAYSVTNVNDDGTIPKASAWQNNWDDPKLNNYRQNVPGTQNGNVVGDLTAGASHDFSCGVGGATLNAPICNRGTGDVPAGLSVGFYSGGAKVCGGKTSKILGPGECETVSCLWSTPAPVDSPTVLTVKPNDDGAVTECKADNNEGTFLEVGCPPPPK